MGYVERRYPGCFVKAADDAGLYSEELADAIGLQQEWNDLQQRDISQAAAGVYRRNYFIGIIERLSQAQEVLNNMMDAAGYSQAENARTMDTLQKKYESLKTAAQQLAVALGDAGLLDILKGVTDWATNAAGSVSKLNPELKALLFTALELLAAVKAIKSVGALFGVNATLGSAMNAMPKFLGKIGETLGIATTAAPGWTKLIPLVIAVAGGIALYVSNMENANDVVSQLKKQQEDLINTYKSQIKATDESTENTLGQAEAAEILANKLDELSKKENLNVSEKAQMKVIVEQLNQILPNLNLQIDEQTGKINSNTEAIRKNIEALKAQAIAQVINQKLLPSVRLM